MNQEYTFIGGSSDGQKIAVDEDSPYVWRMSLPNGREVYRKVIFQSDEWRQHVMFIEQHTSEAEAMEKLLKNYKP